MKKLLSALLLCIAAPASAQSHFEYSGRAGAELRLFTHDALFSGQYDSHNLSVLFEPELFWEWNEGSDSLTFTPFLRLDQHDSDRSHADIRQLSWTHIAETWELHTGIRKVYWGVTEFQHLVNIINQTDAVEDIDGEDKLGQPMVNLSLARDWGILDLFILPGFRERTFPGQEGRLRSSLVIDTDQARYESSAKERHIDLAARWSQSIDVIDFGLYWFHGTSRDPLFRPGIDSQGSPVLIPFYEQIDQVGLDLQATIDDWLWKLEAIHRDSNSDQYWALQGGFEYTLVGIAESSSDLGLLMEYGWDERGTAATSPGQNDLFVGARLAINDAASSEVLAGVGYDLDHKSKSVLIEASRRLGDSWKVSLDARLFSSSKPADIGYSLRQDDHLQLTLERFF